MTQLAHKPRLLRRVRRAVLKVGSNVLASDRGLRPARIRALAREVAELCDGGRQIVVVSSGAVAAGVARLPVRRPGLEWRQAAAAVGQPTLMAAWGRALARRGRTAAQVLLTQGDVTDRRRWLNARHTFRALLARGVVPIVNENDTVAIDELKLGDNDNLSALTATLIEADLLVILSDVDGLYDADPRRDPAARLVPLGRARDPALRAIAGPAGSAAGTGGMASKVAAAATAAAAGIPTVIASGARTGILAAVFDPAVEVGTLLLADGDRLAHRKLWIAHTLRPRGTLHLDAGAERAVAEGGRSLLPSGIRAVEGDFGPGDCVRCVGPQGREVARGLVAYGAAEIDRIKGAHTREIARLLGWKAGDEVIHRDDLVVLA